MTVTPPPRLTCRTGLPVFLVGRLLKRHHTEVPLPCGTSPTAPTGLYLYGVNPYANNRGGTLFTVSSGNAHNGIAATLFGAGRPAGPIPLSKDRTLSSGRMSSGSQRQHYFTATANPRRRGNSQLNETAFNGVQLILNPPPRWSAAPPRRTSRREARRVFRFRPPLPAALLSLAMDLRRGRPIISPIMAPRSLGPRPPT